VAPARAPGRFPGAWHPLLVLLLLGALLLGLCLRSAEPGRRDPLRLLEAPGSFQPRASRAVRLTGRLQADLRQGAAPCRAVLQLEAPLEGATALRFAACPALQEGWRLEAQGLLRRPMPAPHPLLAGAAERLARQGIHTELRVGTWRLLAKPATPVADLRRRIAERFLAVAGPEVGGLLAALVLGSAVVPLPAGLTAAFRVAGLSHALAASGFHLTVLLGAVLALAKPLGRRLRLPLAAAAIVLFLLLAGPQASVVRACVSGGLALLILEGGRRGRPIGLLGLTVVLMLLLKPVWWADLGFQLSVAATAGLLVSAAPLERRLAGPQGGRWRQLLAAAVAVPLAASLWTLPLQLLHFGLVPLYAVPANLVVEPLLTPLTLGAMALALVALLAPPLLAPLAWLVGLPARLLLLVAHGVAALPMAQWQTGRPQPLLVGLFSLALLALLVPRLGRPWRRGGLVLLALVVGLHTAGLRADQLLLVHQAGADLLVARHGGRAAALASRGDGVSCQRLKRLAEGLGVQRFDWLVLLDPVASPEPACWRDQAGVSLLSGEAGPPLALGQRLRSPGLELEALSLDSQAYALQVGRLRWLLLPDRQALEAVRGRRVSGRGLWLGFSPRKAEQLAGQALGGRPVWLSGSGPARSSLPPHWRSTGRSGFLSSPG
jgi:competence protein ComEC